MLSSTPAEPVTRDPVAEPGETDAGGRRARRRARRKPPWSWRFFGAHYGVGVASSLVVLPGSYALATWAGHRGHGLSPVIGAMLIAAFVPTPITYTAQWAMGRSLSGRRERYWPGFLVAQLGHLAVFSGAVLGGADFQDPRHFVPVVFADAVGVTGLASLTAEATRRPLPEPPSSEHAGAYRPPEIIVPVLEVQF